MDSSTRLEYLTGNLRIEISEITAQEWVELFWHVFKMCKSRIKYFTGFQPIAYFANCPIGEYSRRHTPAHVFKFVGDITASDEYAELCLLPPKADIIELSKAGYVEYYKLLLTKTGKVVSWYTKCEMRKEFGVGYRGHREGNHEVAEISAFIELDPSHLNGLIGEMSKKDSRHHPLTLILQFANLVDKTANIAQQRIEGLNNLSENIHSIAARINRL